MSEPTTPPEPVYLIRCGDDWLRSDRRRPVVFFSAQVAAVSVLGKPDMSVEPMVRGSRLEALSALHLDHLKAAADREAGHLRRYTEARAEMERMAAERDEARENCNRLTTSFNVHSRAAEALYGDIYATAELVGITVEPGWGPRDCVGAMAAAILNAAKG